MSQNDLQVAPKQVQFAVVNPEDGDVLRIGVCSLESLDLQNQPGAILVHPVPDEISDLTHYWTGEDFALYPVPQPSPYHKWLGGQWVDLTDHEAELISQRQSALAQITALRGRARLAYITPIPGQEMLYIAKAEEAAAYLSDSDPEPEAYPLIQSEVGITAPTAYEVAQVFSNLNSLWRQAAGSIDAACFQAEAAVQQAPDTQTINGILAALEAAIT